MGFQQVLLNFIANSSGSGNQHLSRFATALTDTAAAMAPKHAVLAAVASRTQREGSMAPDCRMLTSVLPEGPGGPGDLPEVFVQGTPNHPWTIERV